MKEKITIRRKKVNDIERGEKGGEERMTQGKMDKRVWEKK